MTQIWKDGKVVPVTVVNALTNSVAIVRTSERDGYEAVQVELHGARGGSSVKKEFRRKPNAKWNLEDFRVGSKVTVADFKEGDKVSVSGLNKGRGFQGVVKRHNFAGGPKTHGQKNRLRAPGSIGSTAFQRVVKGRRMAGHMGQERVTTKNLVVAEIDVKKNLIMLRGAVPGMRGTIVEIRSK